ncbi:hypothetical protein ABS768_05745 [Flavobacterium sp. ST-75]|uniref:Uncharacterized protein n=1 Tax=Flavobacterium rhizophilum TaxID=3163296 RepID=A0ABW8YAF0_9FLAO
MDKFSDFFVGNSNRNLFLNYTLSSSCPTLEYNSFIFDQGLHRQKWGGFLWMNKQGVKNYFYDVTISSKGGMITQNLGTNDYFGKQRIEGTKKIKL